MFQNFFYLLLKPTVFIYQNIFHPASNRTLNPFNYSLYRPYKFIHLILQDVNICCRLLNILFQLHIICLAELKWLPIPSSKMKKKLYPSPFQKKKNYTENTQSWTWLIIRHKHLQSEAHMVCHVVHSLHCLRFYTFFLL